jgi:hypothetical protein
VYLRLLSEVYKMEFVHVQEVKEEPATEKQSTHLGSYVPGSYEQRIDNLEISCRIHTLIWGGK